jgi:hypothetical protein
MMNKVRHLGIFAVMAGFFRTTSPRIAQFYPLKRCLGNKPSAVDKPKEIGECQAQNPV